MFKLIFPKTSRDDLARLKADKGRASEYKATIKALGFLQADPRHKSLNSQKYQSLKGPNGEPVFESYVQANRPSPYRIFWYYGSGKTITVLNIVPHP